METTLYSAIDLIIAIWTTAGFILGYLAHKIITD